LTQQAPSPGDLPGRNGTEFPFQGSPLEAYIGWREECIALGEAYERWSRVSAPERRLAFAAYRASLDCEQQASCVYAARFDRAARELASQPTRQRRPLLWEPSHMASRGVETTT
jgi:hypothetical protein